MVVQNVRMDDSRPLLEMLEAVRQGAQGSSAITVRILAAADHDGVCAARILDTLLQRVEVKFTVVPVTGNTDIVEHLHQLEEDCQLRSLVLLNCGGALDLQQHLEASSAPEHLRCFVIDAHRPLLLANLSPRHERVVVLDDDDEDGGIAPPIDGVDSEHESASRSSGSDKEEEWDPDAAQRGRPQPPRESRNERKRRREAERQARMDRKRRRINEYYLNSYYAMPVAMSLFKMARQAAPPSQDLLWLAAVALTGYQDQGLISEEKYAKLAWEELKEALDNAVDFSSFPSSAGGSQHSTMLDGAASDEEETVPLGRRPVRPAAHQRRKLRFGKELRLTLYKHWTLEESIMHSSYFYGSMELNRDKGLRALKSFFAEGGIPPSDYRQIFDKMQLPIKKNLHQLFRERGKAFGLVESRMFLDQFVRDLGNPEEGRALRLHDISCADAVHILTALLSLAPQSLSTNRLELLPHTADGHRDMAAINEMERQAMVSNFWRAFDAVMCSEPGHLRDGITEAVEVAKTIQNLARLIRDTKAMHSTRFFRWCKIEQPHHLFRHPVAVRRLAVWLLHVLYTFRPKGEAPERPLLVIVRDHIRDTYLCVGITPERSAARDEFGKLFRSALRADRTLKFRYDFFDKSCIEVAAEDFDRFWEFMNEPEG